MTIYYLDPFTDVNGTGTFASPWSANSSTRTGLTNGDEIRVLGRPTANLFTSTVYTARKTSASGSSALTITAGGGQGADFAANDYIWAADLDCFQYVGSVTANNLTVAGSFMYAMYANTHTSYTFTVRKYDTVNNNPSSTTAGQMYILGTVSSLSNVIVSDGWTDETTRVTDGSVKSVFRSTSSSLATYNIDTTVTPTTWANNNIDLYNSHFLNSRGTSSTASVSMARLVGEDSVYRIGSSTPYYYTNGGISVGISNYPVSNVTVYVGTTNLGTATSLLNSAYGENITVYATNLGSYDPSLAYFSPSPYSSNIAINVTNAVYQAGGGGSWMSMTSQTTNAQNVSIKITGSLDSGGSSITPATGFSSGFGNISMDITGATIYRSYRTLTGATSMTNRYLMSTGASIPQRMYFPNSSGILPGVAATNPVGAAGLIAAASTTQATSIDIKKPTIFILDFENRANSANASMHAGAELNYLYTYRDGSDPIEYLGIYGDGGFYTSVVTSGSFPVVSRDAAIFRTAGPSLRSTLVTRSAAYWNPTGMTNRWKSYKNIKIPIVSGSNYTISGYIRSSYSLSTTSDVIMSVIYNNTVLDSHDMTSAMYNSWESFTLTFTASATGEAYLVWEMYYPSGSMSYWLDDLSIVKS